jgi:predicted short-subunit dehydrogenase-like oxidoreductase (DUF2520 family)
VSAQTITIVGQGKVGLSLADAIQQKSPASVSGPIPARAARFEIDSEVVIIATRDDMVVETSRKVIESATERLEMIVQVAGSIAPSALAARHGVSVLTLHPMQTISSPSADSFRDIYWMCSSDDPSAIDWAGKFVADLGGLGLLVLEEPNLPLYHAMTVFSSNFITLLMSGVEEIAVSMKLEPETVKQALKTLAETALQNALQNPANSVLTGPFIRKDFLTIRKHQNALSALDPKLKCIYDAFFGYAVKKKPDAKRKE